MANKNAASLHQSDLVNNNKHTKCIEYSNRKIYITVHVMMMFKYRKPNILSKQFLSAEVILVETSENDAEADRDEPRQDHENS